MTQQLDQLIRRIQDEGFNRADARAGEIVNKAREEAAAIVKDATSKAAAILEKADKDSEIYTTRSRKSLEQAARDIVILVGQGVEKIFRELAERASGESLSGTALDQMLIKICDAYVARGLSESRLEVLVGAQDRQRIETLFREKFRDAAARGIEIKPDGDIVSGFKVVLKDKSVSHDFTQEAVTESLLRSLRPHLAEIVQKAVAVQGRETK